MPHFHSLNHSISGVPGIITPGHPLWACPLSGRSEVFEGRSGAGDSGWTVGDYFQAAESFLAEAPVMEKMAHALGDAFGPPDSWDLCLDLQKHGAFYHPVRLTVQGRNRKQAFALNGAVTEHGRAAAANEEALFVKVFHRLPQGATPGIVAAGEVECLQGKAGFFLTFWLEGFHEFHLTAGRNIVVWRPGAGDLMLPLNRILPLYENIARILTRAHDPETGDQILFWHHAAGDFITNPDLPDLPVKLITVRAYGPLADEEMRSHGPLPALLFFFANLCLRMQLDRQDGVGTPVFLGEGVLESTVRGFFKGLGDAAGESKKETLSTVWDFLSQFSGEQFDTVIMDALSVWPPGRLEAPLVSENLPVLSCQIARVFKSGRVSDFY